MSLPAYEDGSIVNLTSSLFHALGAPSPYPTLPALPPERVREARTVVLMVLDGLGYEYLARHAAPNLKAHLAGRLTSVFPSTTATAVTSFLTGVGPMQHGVTGWFMNLREVGGVVAILPFRPRAGGPPLNREGVEPTRIFDVTGPLDRLSVPATVITHQDILGSAYSQAMTGPVPRLGYTDVEGFFGHVEDLARAEGGRRYVYAYWREIDALSHRKGVGSAEVASHLEELDAAFGRLLGALRGTDTLLVLSADHGLVDTRPERVVHLEDHPELDRTLALPLCGEPRTAYCYVRPARAAAFERYVATHLEHCCTLHRSEDLVREGFFGIGEAHPRLLDRIGDYVLQMHDDWVIKDRLLGEEDFRQVGVHGGTSDDELYVPLVVAAV